MKPDSELTHHLRALELRLLDPEIRRDPAEVHRLLADDFVEYGSSGQVFDKMRVIAALQSESPARRSADDFRVRMLAPEIALVTYRAITERTAGAPQVSLRSSIWARRPDGWQIVFHQGTPASTTPGSVSR